MEMGINIMMLYQIFTYLFCREIDYKVNRVWNENGTVTFQRKKVWFFEQSMSNGKLTDQVTNINPIVVVRRNYFNQLHTFLH